VSLNELETYRDAALEALEAVDSGEALEAWYRSHLAPSGQATAWKKQIGRQAAEDRRAFGQTVNAVSQALQAAFAAQKERIRLVELADRMKAEAMDVTLPGRPRPQRGLHPVTAMLREVCEVFEGMGFTVFESPHVELDETNFQLLNIPEHHPAREMQDTFYVNVPDQGERPPKAVMRTHTSPGQIRAMRAFGPGPIRVVLPGRCYRNEDITPRSEIQFHQVEGLLIGERVRMSDLKGALLLFARRVFGEDQAVRLRGSYFPFTEPSVEVDIQCTLCCGEGCRLCKSTGWLELLGAGVVHPNVLRNGGYDPDKVRGFAFGLGIERLVMLRYGISDIRHFAENDVRFLAQFA